MSKYFHLQVSFGCSIKIFTEALFCFKLAHLRQVALIHSIPMKSRNFLACGIFHTSDAYLACVHDVTDTDLEQNGSTLNPSVGFNTL